MTKTYNELYIALRQKLREAEIEACSLEARLLLCCAAGKTQEALLRDLQLYASAEIEARAAALCRRRLRGEPAAYLTGCWGFYGLELKVTPAVLIPRTDTEVLASAAVARLRQRAAGARVLDLCTGSGCVGCAVAAHAPESRVLLLDDSVPALAVAAENVAALGLAERVSCLCADVLEAPPANLGSFDLILGNPPYVTREELNTLDRSVKDYEPLRALDGGTDGLAFYRAIAGSWVSCLRRGGEILLEVGEAQAEAVIRLLRRAGLRSLTTVPDTRGVPRVVCGKR